MGILLLTYGIIKTYWKAWDSKILRSFMEDACTNSDLAANPDTTNPTC